MTPVPRVRPTYLMLDGELVASVMSKFELRERGFIE